MQEQHEGAAPTGDTPTQQAPTATLSIRDTTDRTVLNDWRAGSGGTIVTPEQIPAATAYVYGLQDGWRAGYAAGRADEQARADQLARRTAGDTSANPYDPATEPELHAAYTRAAGAPPAIGWYSAGLEDGRAAGWRAATRWVQRYLGPSRKRVRRLARADAARARRANLPSCDAWRGVTELNRGERVDQYRRLIGSWSA